MSNKKNTGIWTTIERTEFTETKVLSLKSGKAEISVLHYQDQTGFGAMVVLNGPVEFPKGEFYDHTHKTTNMKTIKEG